MADGRLRPWGTATSRSCGNPRSGSRENGEPQKKKESSALAPRARSLAFPRRSNLSHGSSSKPWTGPFFPTSESLFLPLLPNQRDSADKSRVFYTKLSKGSGVTCVGCRKGPRRGRGHQPPCGRPGAQRPRSDTLQLCASARGSAGLLAGLPRDLAGLFGRCRALKGMRSLRKLFRSIEIAPFGRVRDQLCGTFTFVFFPSFPPAGCPVFVCGRGGQGLEGLLSDRPAFPGALRQQCSTCHPSSGAALFTSLNAEVPRPAGVWCPPMGAPSYGASGEGVGHTSYSRFNPHPEYHRTFHSSESPLRSSPCQDNTAHFFFLRDLGISFRIHIFDVTPTLTAASS